MIHVLISALLAAAFIYFCHNTDFSKGIIGYIVILIFICKMFFTMCAFIRYIHIFHGSNTAAVLLFTVMTIIIFHKSDGKQISQMYSMFVLFNLLLAVMIVLLGADKLNAANIYANDTDINFSVSKLNMFYDVLTLAVIVPKGKLRIYAQKRFLCISVAFIIFTIIFQGLCISGDMLYSISPLHGIFQIYSGNTIKRFDYFLAIIQTMNYFAAVILYTEAVKKIYIHRKADYE